MKTRHSKRLIFVLLGIFVAAFSFTMLLNKFNQKIVEAADLSKFNPGNIISNYIMSDHDSMTETEIQAFLTAKNPCKNTDYDYYQYLTSLNGEIWHWDNEHFICLSEEKFGEGTDIGTGETAAHIIYEIAQSQRINPQVLLVLLEKETGLISDPIPNIYDYRKAVGYGCYDSETACRSEFYGFKNQLTRAAKLFREVLDGGWTNYPVGDNYIQYHPDTSCGGTIVNIQNLATSSLYRYTPYQPNTKALSAGYGQGDYCSSYGNRNFYQMFYDWFGDPTIECEQAFCDLPESEDDKSAIMWLYDNNITKYYAEPGKFAPNINMTMSQYATFLSRIEQEFPQKYQYNHTVIETLRSNNAQLQRQEAIYYLWKFLGVPVRNQEAFYDYPQDELGKISIDWAYQNGITKYYGKEGEFAPYANITRREVVIFLWRMMGQPEVDITNDIQVFDDLPEDELGRKAIIWAYQNGITKYYGKEGEFAPYANITRRELVIFLWRMMDKPITFESDFNDLPQDPYTAYAINWAYQNGITKFYIKPQEFSPKSMVTRREMALFLWRAIGKN